MARKPPVCNLHVNVCEFPPPKLGGKKKTEDSEAAGVEKKQENKVIINPRVIPACPVTARNSQTAGQTKVKTACFPSYLMRAVCFRKEQTPDYGRKKAMAFPLSPLIRSFIQQQRRNVKAIIIVWTVGECWRIY